MTVAVERRRHEIVDLVRAHGFMSTAELAERFSVSEMSIRRDAEVLGSSGDLARVRGGLVPTRAEAPDSEDTGSDEPLGRIARAAARRIAHDAVIMIDAGRTALALADCLPDAFHGTVISHSVPVLERLTARPDVTTIGLGGELYQRSRALIGTAAVAAVERLRAEVFFMGAAGVTGDGVYALRDVERPLKQAMMHASKRTLVLADHTKFSTMAPVFLTGWSTSVTVLTDRRPPEPTAAAIRAAGATVEVVPAQA